MTVVSSLVDVEPEHLEPGHCRRHRDSNDSRLDVADRVEEGCSSSAKMAVEREPAIAGLAVHRSSEIEEISLPRVDGLPLVHDPKIFVQGLIHLVKTAHRQCQRLPPEA